MHIYHKVTSQAVTDFISLSEAKTQCRLMESFTMDDDYISDLILSWSELAQSFCNRLLTEGEVMCGWESFTPSVQLWGGDIDTITKLEAMDSNGNLVEITDFVFHTMSQKIFISNSYYSHSAFTATYKAGMKTTSAVVKHAVKMMVSTAYNSHDDLVIGLTVADMPVTSIDILKSVKHYVS